MILYGERWRESNFSALSYSQFEPSRRRVVAGRRELSALVLVLLHIVAQARVRRRSGEHALDEALWEELVPALVAERLAEAAAVGEGGGRSGVDGNAELNGRAQVADGCFPRVRGCRVRDFFLEIAHFLGREGAVEIKRDK